MTCFEWQNRASDFLDGTLTESSRREAEEHLQTCKACQERNNHYRVLLTTLASQPKGVLPAPIRKAPLSAALPRAETAQIALSRWEQLPWYLRTFLEAFGIILFVSVGVSSAPKVRSIYEQKIEKSLNEFKESISVKEPTPESIVANASIVTADSKQATISQDLSSGDDVSGGDDNDDAEENVRVGKSQLWRFTLKTVSPDEVRPKVIQALNELNVPKTTAGINGMQVPGGIEFDLVLPQSVVPNLKKALQKLSPHSNEGQEESAASASFSWYKVKSKRKLPDGTSQVVIWLAQPTN